LSFTAGYAVHFFPCISTNQQRKHQCTRQSIQVVKCSEKTRHI
jgi:hypothetical protein